MPDMAGEYDDTDMTPAEFREGLAKSVPVEIATSREAYFARRSARVVFDNVKTAPAEKYKGVDLTRPNAASHIF